MLELSYGVVIWTTISFLITIFILGKFGWKPVMKALKDRENTIKDALQSAEKAREEMKKLNASNEELIREARIERDQLLKKARETKEKIVAEAKEAASKEGDKIIVKAKETIENEKKAAVAEIKNQVAKFSIEIAEKIIKNELKEDDNHQKFIQEEMQNFSLN